MKKMIPAIFFMAGSFLSILLFSEAVRGDEPPLADLGKGLSTQEEEDLLKGKMVFKTVPLPGKVWPQVTVYALVEASPLEAMAVYADFEHQKDYVPDMVKSEVIAQNSPEEVVVSYEMDLPWPVPNLTYITRNILERPVKSLEGYRLTWIQLESSGTLQSEGKVRFAPWKGKVMAMYTNWVDPDSLFAPWLLNKFLKDVQKSFRTILDYIEATGKRNPPELGSAKERILGQLKGEKVYLDLVEKRKAEMPAKGKK